jgi:hypothetical protein
MSAEEPIEMSPIGRSELGDAISRRARFFSALDQFCICSLPAATSSAKFIKCCHQQHLKYNFWFIHSLNTSAPLQLKIIFQTKDIYMT